jgi:hypothetical protein
MDKEKASKPSNCFDYLVKNGMNATVAMEIDEYSQRKEKKRKRRNRDKEDKWK